MIARLRAELAALNDDDMAGMTTTKKKAVFHAMTNRPKVRCNAEGCRSPNSHNTDECWLNITCGFCKVKGHPERKCNRKPKEVEEETKMNAMNEEEGEEDYMDGYLA